MRAYLLRVAIGLDAFVESFFHFGLLGVTISSRIGTAAAHQHTWGRIGWWLLDRVWPFGCDADGTPHCVSAIAHDIAAAAAANQVFAGPVPASALTKGDLEFLWWANANPATPKLHNWAYTVLSGSRRDIQVALASVSADIAWLGHYDATKYAGVLRSYYDEAVKA